jgi:tetratricopeptide (TPR) repeat protein/serine/threonine protein kinase
MAGLDARPALELLKMSERSIFLAALELDPAERPAYLDRVCAGDPALRSQVEQLLEAHQGPGAFMERPAPVLVATVDEPAAERPGTVIGPYKLLEPIGEGGFGVVFLAEQTQPVRRKVALKVLKPGMDSAQVVARFEAERQALALMDHPHIARVFDGGQTASGRPYFVMELVKGLPITRFCDDNRLTVRQRLELFVSVCAAVQHAHHKGIIHRDLKPSNILVTRHDTTPVVKVIDFGIAKALGQELTDKTLFTGLAQMIGTPLYMSPEQAGLSGLDIDTRSDIYSLGVLLYELLTGTTPFDKERFKEADYDELRRIIREEEPPRPSTRLSTLGPAAPTVSARRGSDPKRLSQLLCGELDWIVMKALDKDRGRRYETANGFAMDVQRYLADEPVLACPPSAGYRFRKFARRNKGTLVTAALLGAMLLVVAGSFGWVARDRAARRGRNAEAVTALLDQCEDALRADGADRAAIALEAAERRAADGGAEGLAGRLAHYRADLDLLRDLDKIDSDRWKTATHKSRDLKDPVARWRAALADYGVTPDEGQAAEVAARVNRSLVRDRLLEALDLWLKQEPSDGVRAVLRSADPDPYRNAVRDAHVVKDARRVAALVGQPEALAQPARFAVVLAGLDDVPADRLRAVLESALRGQLGHLGLLMALGGSHPLNRPEAAGERVRWYQAAVAAHPESTVALTLLGMALMRRRDSDGASAAFREAIRLDPTDAHAHNNLGLALGSKKNLDGAIAEIREAIRLEPDEASFRINLGAVLLHKGDLDGAIAEFREAVRLDPKDAHAHNNLGAALRHKGDLDGAIAEFREAIRLRPTHASTHANLGYALRKKGDLDGVIAAHREAVRLAPKDARWRYNLGHALQAKGELGGAITAFKEVVRLDPKDARSWRRMGRALQDKGDLDGAVAAYREAVRLRPTHAPTRTDLGNALSDKGDVDGAIAQLREAIRLDPKDADAHGALGAVLSNGKRDYDGAILAFKKAIRLDSNDASFHSNLGVALFHKGDLDGAIAQLREAIRLDPKDADAHNNLGAVLCDGKRDYAGAIRAFKKAIRLAPKDAQAHYNLGNALRNKGDLKDAVAAYREAVRLDPKCAEAHEALACLLATGPASVRDGKRAVEHATRACELTGWKDPCPLTTLAAAHAEAGDFEKAVEFQKKALSFPGITKAAGKVGRERLDLYERKMPYRDPALVPVKD